MYVSIKYSLQPRRPKIHQVCGICQHSVSPLVLSKGLILRPHSSDSGFSVGLELRSPAHVSPEILRQVCLQTPGILAQSWENIQDPSDPCWQVPVTLKEEGWVVLLPCSTMGRRYPFLLRPSLWLVCPRAGEGVRKSQALKNRQVWGCSRTRFLGTHWSEPNDGSPSCESGIVPLLCWAVRTVGEGRLGGEQALPK